MDCSKLNCMKTGYFSEDQIKFPSDERLSKKAAAVIECCQEIPCNPCMEYCPFEAIKVEGNINADPLLPIIPFGHIEFVDRRNPEIIALFYSAPKDVSNEQLLLTARQISSKFPLTYQKVEITFSSPLSTDKKQCRLWFSEGQNGETYIFDSCN